MFYYLSQQLLEWSRGTRWEDRLSGLRLFNYITVRSAGVTIGTIRVTALPAFTQPTVPSPAILDRELAELIA